MFFRFQKTLFVRFIVILFFLGGMPGPKQALAAPPARIPSSNLGSPPEAQTCEPHTGWVWTAGPARPEVAQQAELALQQEGIEALVTAADYGEKDSCGNFEPFSMDFMVTLESTSVSQLSPEAESQVADNILTILSQFGKPRLGNVRIDFGSGAIKTYAGTSTAADIAQIESLSGPALHETALFNKKVFLLVYNPILSNGQDLNTYMRWPAYATLVRGIIDSFNRVSRGQLQYTIVETQVITDEWPVKIDGFRYTEETYLPVVTGLARPHEPDLVDHDPVMNDPQLDICGKVNRGEIDELWVYGMAFSGFYESTLAGPSAYWFNSPPIGVYQCNKLLPIMGLNYERGLAEAMHSFGHRAESTMARTYVSWQQDRTAHNWERFALVKALSPSFSYSGCGNVHFPPNGISDYDYGNPGTVVTNCDDFRNYPNLSAPLTVAEPVTCSTWNCDQLLYLLYWFSHFPSFAGCGPDGVANNWWSYFVDPVLSLTPSLNCAPTPPPPPPPVPTGDTVRVSVTSNGDQVTGFSGHASISADGRYVAFDSSAPDLVPGDTNRQSDVFLRDLQTGITTRVSVNSSGDQGNSGSLNPSISADGRYIAFESHATNFVPEDTNLAADIFVHDTQTGQTRRVSVDSSGGQAVEYSLLPSISADGRIIAFRSIAANLVPGGNGSDNIYMHDMQTGMTTRIDVGPNGELPNEGAYSQAISADGRYVSFMSSSSNVVPGDTNHQWDVFVYALQTGVIRRVSVASDGTQANGRSDEPALSADGRYAVFKSHATNLVPGDTNGHPDIFLHDMQTGVTTLVSLDSHGGQGNGASQHPSISADGRYVAFESDATNFPGVDTNLAADIFVRDLQTGMIKRVSVDSNGMQANNNSSFPVISADGQSIAFESVATNLVPGDTNGTSDVFLHRLTLLPPPAPTLFLSLANNRTVGGVSSADEDILRFDGTNWSLFFDGSDVGVSRHDLVGFALVDADTLLMTFGSTVKINGITATPQDVLRFDATSLGRDTAGTFSLYFDGSDVGVNHRTNERIDSLSLLPDGRLLISTIGNPNVSGLTSGRDEDVLAFTPTSLGDVTSGTWTLYVDGSDVDLSNNNGEDIDALDAVDGKIYLSTWGRFSVSGLSGEDEDVFVCAATSLGAVTACDYSPPLFFDGSSWGLTGNDVDALGFLPTGSVPSIAGD